MHVSESKIHTLNILLKSSEYSEFSWKFWAKFCNVKKLNKLTRICDSLSFNEVYNKGVSLNSKSKFSCQKSG